jgi:hypothetical protein
MATSFSPSRSDVERYRRFRALSTELSHKIVQTIPEHIYDEVGDAIGILHNGVLVFDSEHITGVLMDCCLYDWFENGKNLVQRYAETHPAESGSDESYLLSAYSRAIYRVLVTETSAPDAGLYCRDIVRHEDLFLMDLAMSRSFGAGEAARGRAFASRTIPLGDFWMTDGAFLPINSKEAFLNASKGMEYRQNLLLQGPGGMALSIVRACLAAGAADWVGYEPVEAQTKKRRIEPRFPGFKRRRRQK